MRKVYIDYWTGDIDLIIIKAKCRKITEKDLVMLMNWRMMPEITKYMNTDPKLTLEDQVEWYKRIIEDAKKKLDDGRQGFYWILEVDEEPVGFVSLVDIDIKAKKVYTGVYIAVKAKRSLRLILDVQWNLYRYAFDILGMNKVCEEVFAQNEAVNRILDMCGSKREGLLRSHICKNGTYYDVVVRGILKDEWNTKKEMLAYNNIELESY